MEASFGVEAGNGAKKLEIDRWHGVDVELRLVVIAAVRSNLSGRIRPSQVPELRYVRSPLD